jgi:hypothetical protein
VSARVPFPAEYVRFLAEYVRRRRHGVHTISIAHERSRYYSHSIVAGGLLVMSSTTRFT